jgi:hypothetical protein
MKVFKEIKKGGAMKRIIMLAMVLVIMLVSIGGCWVGWDEGGRGGRGEGSGRDGGHDRDGGHGRDQRHEERR